MKNNKLKEKIYLNIIQIIKEKSLLSIQRHIKIDQQGLF